MYKWVERIPGALQRLDQHVMRLPHHELELDYILNDDEFEKREVCTISLVGVGVEPGKMEERRRESREKLKLSPSTPLRLDKLPNTYSITVSKRGGVGEGWRKNALRMQEEVCVRSDENGDRKELNESVGGRRDASSSSTTILPSFKARSILENYLEYRQGESNVERWIEVILPVVRNHPSLFNNADHVPAIYLVESAIEVRRHTILAYLFFFSFCDSCCCCCCDLFL